MSKRGVGIGLIALALFMLLGFFNTSGDAPITTRAMTFVLLVLAPGAGGVVLIKKHNNPDWDPLKAFQRMRVGRKATEDSEVLFESLSEGAIKSSLLSAALRHPTTVLPAILALVSIAFVLGFIPGPSRAVAIALLARSALAATGSFVWRYALRSDEAYATRLRELSALRQRQQRTSEQAELADLRKSLGSGFQGVESSVGLKALNELAHEYDELLPALDRRSDTDPLAVAQIPALGEQTYRQGLSVLTDALGLIRAIHTSNAGALEAEVAELEKEIESLGGSATQAERVSLKEATVASHRKRLELVNNQQLHVDRLLYQSDRCEASLHETRIELAALQAGRSGTDVGAVTGTLQRTIQQAKEVQEELKRLGF